MQKNIFRMSLMLVLATPAICKEHDETTGVATAAMVAPIGTKIKLVLKDAVDVETVQDGQRVRAYSKEDVLAGGKLFIPVNTLFCGNISHIFQDDKAKRFGLDFNSLTLPDGKSIAIYALPAISNGSFVRINRGHSKIMIDAYDLVFDKPNGRHFTMFGFKNKRFVKMDAGDEMNIVAVEDIRSQ